MDILSPPPLIIVGAGRSGSTLLHELLAYHPQTAWVSGISNKLPYYPKVNQAVLTLQSIPLFARLVDGKLGPREAYPFWEKHAAGFRRPMRDLTMEDVTRSQRRHIPQALNALTTSRRKHLVLKITGWPRMGFLHAILPQARFVHLIRDGRAVAASYMALGENWWGWRGPQNWRFGPLPPIYQEEWEQHRYSFAALAGIQWKLIIDAVGVGQKTLPVASFMEVRYEDMCKAPMETLRTITDFAGIPWLRSFERQVQATNFRSANEKWRQDLSDNQQSTLEAVLYPHLMSYGYNNSKRSGAPPPTELGARAAVE